MKEVKDVKLGIKDGDVVVTATVDMKADDDRDDLYFVMFNILDDPLRLVVAVASNFADFLVTQGYRESDIKSWLDNDIQQYHFIYSNKSPMKRVSINITEPISSLIIREYMSE